ncbi:hypothetical protein ABT083_30415 [Streptomyces goshikiensis]|uniref:hypothetical protein n=1 Tax=Streptomyces goshikiensis TaxID=1942 RepID=UPI003326EC63
MTDQSITKPSSCPVAWLHPDDLLHATDPGLQLTHAEVEAVRGTLTDLVTRHLASLQQDMTARLETLHPMPIDPGERRRWYLQLAADNDPRSSQYHYLEDERAAHNTLRMALAKGDWATLLLHCTRSGADVAAAAAAGNLTSTKHAESPLQQIREAWDKRAGEQRAERARRIGCTCLGE